MRAYGSDRVEPEPGGRIALLCREVKGWTPRLKSARSYRVDHPGTAVLWEDAHWEVLSLERRAAGGVRYVLAPWDPVHVIRVSERYDEESEAERAERRRLETKAAGHRGVLVLLAPLAGLLPEEDQLALDHRLGVSATRMTLLSAIGGLMFGTFSLLMIVASAAGVDPGVPIPVLLVGVYLFAESFARLIVVMAQSRPIGSALTLPWVLLKAIRAPEKELVREPDARDVEEELRHTYHTLEPVLALLPRRDQEALAVRFAFDALSWGRTTARVLSGIGTLFAASAVLNVLARIGRPADLVWFAAGALLFAEQRVRLSRIRAGEPAGSVLGFLVRGVSRPIVQPPPPGSAEPPGSEHRI